jgi:O-antigen ligase
VKSSTQSRVDPILPGLWRKPANGAPSPLAGAAIFNPDSDVLLNLAFRLFIVDLFLTASRLLEVITMAGGSRVPYLGVTIHVITLALAVISGGARRVATSKIGIYLGLFTCWMLACTIASTWRGGSVDVLLRQWLPSLIIFLSCGSVVTLRQCGKVATFLATASALIATTSFFLGTLKQDRLAFETGSLGNANEFSMLVVLGAPFLLVPIFSSSLRVRKVVAAAFGAVVLIAVVRTASRSSLLAVVTILAVLFLTRPLAGKVKLAALTAALIFVLIAATPREILSRYATIFGDSTVGDEVANSALESSLARQHLLQQSLKLTMEHPVFGLGPGIFAVGEADLAKEEGQKATWHVSHNSYTQVSSEMGIPGVLLYLMALWATFRNVFWFRAHSRIDPTGRASALGLALLLSLIGLCVNLAFSSNAYFSYLPSLMGLSVVFRKSLEREMDLHSPAVTAPQVRLPAQNMTVKIELPHPAAAKSTYKFLGRPRRSRA